jgi:cellulose synthase/poly-beta-1,6-N-acetylglucosamine synthase-like glycosyltransferase
MKVSMIIPTLNEEKCLPRLLESVKEQTMKPYEVIVVDGKELLDKMDDLAKRDAFRPRSDLIKAMILEYVQRHHPGNPTLPLEHWTHGLPFSQAAKEKLEPKDILERIKCDKCEGRGCASCGGLGFFFEG